MKNIPIIITGMAIIWIAMSFCVDETTGGALEIDVANTVGDAPLQLETGKYTNALGQSFTISNFKYYISHVVLENAKGKSYESEDYFLVSEDDDASKKLLLEHVPDGDYTLSFTLGVDSLHNCSGAQSGALDPVNGMYWAWNTGYIFLKLEGKSPQSGSPGHLFEFHIGGYRYPNNCIRRIRLMQMISIRNGEAKHITLKADAAQVLQSPETIDFTKLSSVTDFHHATMIADNYTDMFSISTP